MLALLTMTYHLSPHLYAPTCGGLYPMAWPPIPPSSSLVPSGWAPCLYLPPSLTLLDERRRFRKQARHQPLNQYLSSLVPRNGKVTRQTCRQRNSCIAFLTMNKFAATFQPQKQAKATKGIILYNTYTQAFL